jgi:4,5-DOPA dioxygenase extradiol
MRIETDQNPPYPLFVPHGAPTFACNPVPPVRHYAGSPHPCPPRAIVVSARTGIPIPTVGTADRLETIHDFYGFPEELYPCAIRPAAAARRPTKSSPRWKQPACRCAEDKVRGLDHGAWVPLRLMFPDADVPVIPLSMQSTRRRRGLPARPGAGAADRARLS